MTRVAIVQSNYIPWKGYFDLIASVDRFIIFDEAQYTRQDWRNRNRIKTAQGLKWLTVPVTIGGLYLQSINETRIADPRWALRHWKTLVANYRRAPHFEAVAGWLEPIYREPHAMLSELNVALLRAVGRSLGVPTPIVDCRDFALVEGRTERVASLCQQTGADVYVSGPAAKAYLDIGLFADAGISVEWFDYSGYPEYPQLWGDFVHEVSILDLLFNCGPDAPRYMKHVR